MAYTTINKSTDYFNTVTYTGNGGTQTITGVGFQPDFTWVKGRDYAYYHYLQDSIRGSQKILYTNNTDTEATITAGISAWNADGYVTGSQGALNYNGRNFVAWNWKANGAGSSNTDGSINSTVSVNTTSGFSIVKWTSTDTAGSTIGHGLGSTPKMIITKKITSGNPGNWTVYHNSLGNTKSIALNTTGAEDTATSYWNNTTPTSSVFSTGTYFDAGDYIAYCFAEKTGYSKFGKYTGNGSTDGAFVYTGFKPAFLMIKRTSGTDQWILYDTKRETGNVMNLALTPDTNDTEQDTSSYNTVDIISNGFKCRGGSSGSGTGTNQSGGSYIYMAFAEAPLVGSNNVPCTAR
jgi:hypothetical protein